MNKMEYSRPPIWYGKDLSESTLHHNFLDDSLVERLVSLANKEVISLREDAAFKDSYIKLHKELEEGVGLYYFKSKVLKDLPESTFRTTFYKLCLFIGTPVPIDITGTKVKEIYDSGFKDTLTKPIRGHLTNQKLEFHSDRSDLTSFACWSKAAFGGEFKICSSSLLVSLIESNKVEVLNVLSSPIPHDLRNESKDGKNICEHPIYYENNGNFVLRYIRRFISSVVRHDIQVSKDIIEAIDYLDKLLLRCGIAAELDFCRGDFIVFNNHITLHSRNAFTDTEQQKRKLYRCWLSSEFTRKLPESYKGFFHDVRAGQLRGGVRKR